MSLQVWLPFNNNINNQGVTGALTQVTAPTYVDGKIGKAMSTGALTIPAATAAKFYNNKAMSFCFWIYTLANSSIGTPIIGQSAMAAGDNRMFTIFQYPTSADLHLSWQNETATGTFLSGICTGYMPNNTWTHIAITYDGSTAKIYQNGIYKTSVSGTSARSNFSYNVPIPNCAYRYLNDFRIYDEVLSEKQIKEIAKGLVCHYPLDNNGSGLPNLVPNQGKYYSESTAYVRTSASKDGNAWLSGSHFIVEPSTTYTFSVCSDGNLAPSHNTSGKDPSLKLFTMWLYLCNSDTTKNPDAGGYDNPVCFTSANYNHQQIGNRHIWQYTTKSTETHMSVRVNNYSDGTNNLTIKYWQIKIEKGNIASPWCPNSTDASYSIFNINGNKEIDISGYGNHGTKSGTITYNSDTPRYSTSTVFNGSNTFIACGRGGMVKDAITISLWAYQSSWSSFTRPISCTEGGGWNFEASGNYISFQCGTGTSSNTYKPVNSQKTYASLAAGWHMFTATYDGLASKIYIDGVLDNTATSYTTKTPIFYNSSNGIFIGAEAGGNQTTPAGTYFNGRISDVRIYATALSADDIKELYQVSASIDTKGNILGYEFDE